MITKYKEGQKVSLGLNVGWVRGLVFVYVKYDMALDVVTMWRIRIRKGLKPVVIKSKETYSLKDCFIAEETAMKGMMLVTRESYQQAADSEKLKSKPSGFMVSVNG